VENFENICKVKDRDSITELFRMPSFFPSFVNAEDNLELMEEASREEL
jgi:hypothetical protein